MTNLVGREVAGSRARVIAVTDEIRRRIEGELRYRVQERLATLALELRTVQAGLSPDQAELSTSLARIVRGVDDTMDDLRDILRGIHPTILSHGGLRPALRMLARRCPVPTAADVTVEARLPGPVEAAAYHLVSEALANVVKHARASLVRVEAHPRDGWLVVSVRDDGDGGADPADGIGLISLDDRVRALGGRFAVHSSPGRGTTVQALLPLR